MIQHNLHIAISGNNHVFIHYYTCIYAVDIMVGIIQNKSAGIIWNVSRVLQHTLCAETFQIFPRFLKMQIGAIHGRFCQNVSSLLQTALAPNAPGVSNSLYSSTILGSGCSSVVSTSMNWSYIHTYGSRSGTWTNPG